jgi:hypothetical protein
MSSEFAYLLVSFVTGITGLQLRSSFLKSQ